MKWYKVAAPQPPGVPFIRRISAGGKAICLVGYQGEVFALAARCPHAGGDLAQGWCQEGKLVCPVHRYSFDLRSGRGSEGQNDYVDAYPVELRPDGIYVGIRTFWEKLKDALS